MLPPLVEVADQEQQHALEQYRALMFRMIAFGMLPFGMLTGGMVSIPISTPASATDRAERKYCSYEGKNNELPEVVHLTVSNY